jgi:hypothetical protein
MQAAPGLWRRWTGSSRVDLWFTRSEQASCSREDFGSFIFSRANRGADQRGDSVIQLEWRHAARPLLRDSSGPRVEHGSGTVRRLLGAVGDRIQAWLLRPGARRNRCKVLLVGGHVDAAGIQHEVRSKGHSGRRALARNGAYAGNSKPRSSCFSRDGLRRSSAARCAANLISPAISQGQIT